MSDGLMQKVGAFSGIAVLAIGLAFVSEPLGQIEGWMGFLAVCFICLGLGYAAFYFIRNENPPNWLPKLVLGAALLRLALGVGWALALPEWGYETEVQQAGYVMEDAFKRDRAAWSLAKSDLALVEAFRDFNASDQYGGLLFLSAGIYRFFGSNGHQALLVLSVAATFSALAVVFTWAFAHRVWGKDVARLSAWGLALYPEAVLLGSSQMREAFGVTLMVWALYGLLKVREERSLTNMASLSIPVLLSIPLSFPFAASIIGVLALAYLGLSNWVLQKGPWLWLALIAMVAIALVVIGRLDSLWIVQSAEWQAYVSANASGWVARQFERMPLWGQLPFLVFYGIFRPLLPAALIADGLPIWRIVAVWRALGWALLLPMLLYASYLILQQRKIFSMLGAVMASNWAMVLVASFRGGGDLWDNPRYRSAFAGIQVMLAAWAWFEQRRQDDPWLKRALVSALLIMAWFVPWYLRRYASFEWPLVEIHQVVGLGLVSAALYIIWDWLSS